MKRAILFTADIEESQQEIFFQFVQVGFVSVCLKQKLYSVNIEMTLNLLYFFEREVLIKLFFLN